VIDKGKDNRKPDRQIRECPLHRRNLVSRSSTLSSHTPSSPAPTTYRLTFAEEADTVVVTADNKLLEELPAHYLGNGGLVPGTEWGPRAYCNRAGTQRT